ncbi:ABC transporter substrate-binding protein [Geodermatophilus sabuli]|uniref:ABC transporter substrate-binding protein n=1 Tax=Geodermatophilus sabuli TaxID=1564158 RepID=A0A7K3VVQ4_9ACTN|nr:ABC transporter substrate-binding protein [Geodermatophilus sabuli]NEK56715.1 ABC transporter substrate-binding protein [Geodermatophilus sabuli]
MRRSTVLPAVAAACLALAGCGGGEASGEPEATGSGTSVTQVSLGVLPLVDLAPIYLGVEEGFFADEGIELSFTTAQGGAAIIPSVLGGELDFGFSNPTSLILARSQGLPVKIIAPGGSSTGEVGADYGAVVVGPGSDITDAAGLAGRRVAVNTLRNIGDTSIRESVRAAGGDPDAVQFVELPLPDMAAALQTGQVDAIWVVEPFLTGALAQGAVPVAWNWIDVSPDLMASAYFTSEQRLQEDPDLVERFATAVARSAEYAQENPEEARDVITTYTQIPPEVVAEVTLPGWEPEVNVDSTQRLIDLALEDELIESEVAVEDLVAESAR